MTRKQSAFTSDKMIQDSMEGMSRAERNRVMELYRDILLRACARSVPDTPLLNRAFSFALDKHKGQRRKGGEPYIVHPLETARILADAGFESEILAAALLHDVIEDCGVTRDELSGEFGEQVADIVDAVSQVDILTVPDPEMSKEDLDILSDTKLLNEIRIHQNRKAFYIKLADRIHNLRTIDVFPHDKQVAKAVHTRRVLIPAAKALHVTMMVDELEALCLKIENPEAYQVIRKGYNRLLKENACVLEGVWPEDPGFKAWFSNHIFETEPVLGMYLVSIDFHERYEESIFRHLIPLVEDAGKLETFIDKEHVELYNIHFTVDDRYPGTPESLFFRYYPEVYKSEWKVTMIGLGHAFGSGKLYYLLEDRYGIRYRLFLQTESQRLRYSHDALIYDDRGENAPEQAAGFNPDEPDEPEHPMIPIYRRNGQLDWIEDGATVLDFAFHINPMIGICATGATINHAHTRIPVHTRLTAGSIVDIQSDHSREHPEDDVPHATIRWFEYLHTRSAVKTLSRWLETHMDTAAPVTRVYSLDKNGKKGREIPIGSTILDYMILVYGDHALHGFDAYLNKSRKPAGPEKILRYGDVIKAEFGEHCKSKPTISWFGILKTAAAREKLVEFWKSTGKDEP